MVVSKRCKVCTALNPDNICISGEYFDKSLPVLIEKISGVKLDPRKANGVMICKLCAIQLVYADVIIDKLQNTLQRLIKPVKETKSKFLSKEIEASTKSDEQKLKTKSPVVRRKSVILEGSLVNSKEKPKEDDSLTTSSKFDSNKDSVESKKEDELKANSPKRVVKYKPEFQNKNEENGQNGETENYVTTLELKKVLGPGAISGNTNFIVSSNEFNKEVKLRAKTPKKLDNEDDLKQNNEDAKIRSMKKFKKIADDEPTTVKSIPATPTKRKQKFEEDIKFGSDNFSRYNICDPTPVKRRYEGNPLDIETDEQYLSRSCNESSFAEMKMLNCVICGKGFSQKASLREHIESCHMGEKLKQCAYCSTEFRSQQKYESHVFSEKCKNTKHACQHPKCNKRFKTIYKMELHMQEKHSSSQQESEVQ